MKRVFLPTPQRSNEFRCPDCRKPIRLYVESTPIEPSPVPKIGDLEHCRMCGHVRIHGVAECPHCFTSFIISLKVVNPDAIEALAEGLHIAVSNPNIEG